MERTITQSFQKWKEKPNRKPLIIRGARQTGKSFSITDFGNSHFEGSIHILNFEKRRDLNAVFEADYEIRRILSELEILINKKITPNKFYIDQNKPKKAEIYTHIQYKDISQSSTEYSQEELYLLSNPNDVYDEYNQ